jgi:hypothetical protein
MRIKVIYELTKNEIINGQDLYDYIPIMYGLLKEEDYESLEGIRLALNDFGLQFEIPHTDDELDECIKFINNQKKLKTKL